MSQELRNRERRNNNSRLYLNRGYNPNVCRLYNKYCYVPLFSFVLFFFFLCADTTWWLSWDPYAPPFSPADEATTSKRQLDPLPSQLSQKTEQKKKKNTQRRDSHTGTSVIHQHDQDFHTINHHGHHAKCRPQKQHILRADEYVKKCLVCWKERLHAARTFSRSRNPMWHTLSPNVILNAAPG